MNTQVQFSALLEAGVQFGHSQSYWNPEMAPYIYGVRRKLHIINLLKTRPLLQKAINEARQIAAGNGKVLFVATKRPAQEIIQQEAEKAGMPYVNKRWPGGMLTNFKTILQSVKRMKQLEEFLQSDQISGLKKKERLSVERDLSKLKASFNGIRDMGSLPDCLFIIDVGHEHIAVQEANKLGIPVIGVVDTNCSPKGVDHIIPGNDDSQKAIALYASLIASVIKEERDAIAKKVAASKVKVDGKTTVTVVKKAAAEVKAEPKAKAEKATPTATDDAKLEAEQKKKPVAKKVIKVSAKQMEEAKAKSAPKAATKPAAKAAAKPAAKKAAVKKTASKPATKKAAKPKSKQEEAADKS